MLGDNKTVDLVRGGNRSGIQRDRLAAEEPAKIEDINSYVGSVFTGAVSAPCLSIRHIRLPPKRGSNRGQMKHYNTTICRRRKGFTRPFMRELRLRYHPKVRYNVAPF